LDVDTAPTPTKGTASVKLIGVAEKATTTEPEVLEPRAEGAVRRDLHGWAGPHGFTVRVVTATASGRDIAARAPPVPVPRVVRVFSHARVILNLRTTSRNGWIAFRLPLVVNAFGCMSSTFSSRRLQNRAVFHVLSSAADHPFSRRLLRPRETLHWVYQAGSGVPLHRYTAGMMFSHFLIFFLANFLICSQATALLVDGHGRLLP